MSQVVDQMHPRIPIVNQDGTPTPFFFDWCRCMRERTGGPTDAIYDLGASIVGEDYVTTTRVAVLEKDFRRLQIELDEISRINYQPFFDIRTITTSTNYTTVDDCIVIAKSKVTITLNSNPKNNEKAIIKRATTAGEVTISAANIDGSTSHVLLMNYEAAHCVYSYDNNAWYIV